jgi:hypothetical protein
MHHHLLLLCLLLVQVVADVDDSSAKSTAGLLYETALLESGFDPDDPKVREQQGRGESVRRHGSPACWTHTCLLLYLTPLEHRLRHSLKFIC